MYKKKLCPVLNKLKDNRQNKLIQRLFMDGFEAVWFFIVLTPVNLDAFPKKFRFISDCHFEFCEAFSTKILNGL